MIFQLLGMELLGKFVQLLEILIFRELTRVKRGFDGGLGE
jgi:hypothetical protein